MSKTKELERRVEELERQVRELQARPPVVIRPNPPVFLPIAPARVYPPYPWISPITVTCDAPNLSWNG